MQKLLTLAVLLLLSAAAQSGEPDVLGQLTDRAAIHEVMQKYIWSVDALDADGYVSVFTEDAERARTVAGELRSGTVGHNAFRTDFGIAFGGFKQSGIGREGGTEGLHPFLETKTVILEERPGRYGAQGR